MRLGLGPLEGTVTLTTSDGNNPPDVVANLLTGLGIDEYFERTDSSGTATLLTDALGSTIALTNPAGGIQTNYTYEPFGKVSVSGTSNANPYQFTGRENDGTGLYYYRARYYSPSFQRFIAQDRFDFAGGDANLYAYAHNDPVNLIDPRGACVGGAPSPPSTPEPPQMSNPTSQPPPPPCSISPEAYDAYVRNLFDFATVGAVVGGVAAGGLVPEAGAGSVAIGAVGGAILFDTLYSEIFWLVNCQ